MAKKTAKKKPPAKKPPAPRRAAPSDEKTTAFGKRFEVPKPMVPVAGGKWAEYAALPPGTKVRIGMASPIGASQLGVVEGHAANGHPMIKLLRMIDGAFTGQFERAQEFEPRHLVPLQIARPPTVVPAAQLSEAQERELLKPAKKILDKTQRQSAKIESGLGRTERTVDPALSQDIACAIVGCLCKYSAITRAGSRLLHALLLNEQSKTTVVNRWYCGPHAIVADHLFDGIVGATKDIEASGRQTTISYEQWTRHIDTEGAQFAATLRSKVAGPPEPTKDSPDARHCAHVGCPRWLVGDLIFGWYVAVIQGVQKSWCHSHAKEGRAEFDMWKRAVAPSSPLESVAPRSNPPADTNHLGDYFDERDRKAAAGELPRATASTGDGVSALHADRAADEIARRDAFAKARENVRVADAARAANPLAIPRGGYETPTSYVDERHRADERAAAAPPATLAKKTRTKKPAPDVHASTQHGCAVDGCPSTYEAHWSHKAHGPQHDQRLLGVADPPKGWWVHEEDAQGRHGTGQGDTNAPSGDSTLRAAYCPGHWPDGSTRTKAACAKAAAMAKSDGFEPELDAMPWDENEPPDCDVPSEIAGESNGEEVMPWEES